MRHGSSMFIQREGNISQFVSYSQNSCPVLVNCDFLERAQINDQCAVLSTQTIGYVAMLFLGKYHFEDTSNRGLAPPLRATTDKFCVAPASTDAETWLIFVG